MACSFRFEFENRSRYDKAGLNLSPDDIPKDGLCRIKVYLDTSETYDMSLTAEALGRLLGTRDKDKLAGLVCAVAARFAASASGAGALTWYVGEVRPGLTSALQSHHEGRCASMPIDAATSLVVVRSSASAVSPDDVWLGIHSEYGPRVFAPLDVDGSLSQTLEALYHYTSLADEKALRIWRPIYHACLKRSSFAALCEECVVCVVPDGYYCKDVSLQSSHVPVTNILELLSQVATDMGCAYAISELSQTAWW